MSTIPKKRYKKTIQIVMNIKKQQFHVVYMNIRVAYKDETKAPESISAAAAVTRPSSAPSWPDRSTQTE